MALHWVFDTPPGDPEASPGEPFGVKLGTVSLADVKASPKLSEMSLVTSMRLSVQPVTKREWEIVCEMAGLDPKALPGK